MSARMQLKRNLAKDEQLSLLKAFADASQQFFWLAGNGFLPGLAAI